MKTKYLSCDGETEVEEEITKADFYEGRDWATDKLIPMALCQRTDGSNFEVDTQDIFEITE